MFPGNGRAAPQGAASVSGAELADRFGQLMGQSGRLVAGVGTMCGLFYGTFGHVPDFDHALGNGIRRQALLLDRRCDFAVALADLTDGRSDILQRLTGIFNLLDRVMGQPGAGLHILDSYLGAGLQGFDHALNVIGRVLNALGQGAHLVCDDGKSATRLTRTCCLDCRVQGQQVGLFGNLANYPHYAADFLTVS